MAASCAPGAADELAGAAAVNGAWSMDARSLLSVSGNGGGSAWSFEGEAKAISVRPQRTGDGLLARRGSNIGGIWTARRSVRLHVRGNGRPCDELGGMAQHRSVRRTASPVPLGS